MMTGGRSGAAARLHGDVEPADGVTRLNERLYSLVLHQLRSPLATICTWAAVLKSPRTDAALVCQGAAVIEASAREHALLINRCMGSLRVLSGAIVLTRAPVTLTGVVAEAVDLVHDHDPDVAVVVSLAQADDAYRVHGDPGRLVQMVSLLIEHVTASAESAGVAISLAHAPPCIALEIEAAPAPIDDGEVPAPRASATTLCGRDRDRAEIRLAVAAQLAELHGGKLDGLPGRREGFRLLLPR
jgi:signal transduction histidine kinase